MAFIEDPEMVQDMMDTWSELVSQVIGRAIDEIGLDSITISEDMAYKAHSMISPEMTRKYLMPVWQRWVSEFKAKGCKVVGIDSDGYIGDLIPSFIESGFDFTFPVEVAAENDVVKFRKIYGNNLAYVGCIDKRAMAAGGKKMIDEINRVVPPLLELGGLIPGCDHGVPEDISWPDFVEFTRILAKMTGWL